MTASTDYRLPASAIPTHWVNLLADLGPPPNPPLHPGTKEPLGPEDLAPLFPMALIEQEVSADPEIEIPEEVREVYGLWRPTPLDARAAARAGPGYPRPHLLQVRGRLSGRLAQAEHGRRSGLLQQAGRDREARDRDRRRPVGLGAVTRLPAVRPRVRGVHGRRLLRPEALPAGDDRDLGRHRAPQPVGAHRGRALAGRALVGQPRHRDLRGGRDRGAKRGHELRARLGAQPRLPAPDGDRPGGDRAARARGRVPGRRGRLRGRRLELRRRGLSLHAPEAPRGSPDAVRRRRARRVPDADQGRLPLRLRRHGRDDPADADVHARARLRPAPGARRRPALPRRRAERQRTGQGGPGGAGGDQPDERVRGRAHVRAHRGDHPGARALARAAGRVRRGRGWRRRRARSG